MKLRTKLTLFNTLSKLVIVTIFVLLLPQLIKRINKTYTDNRLRKDEQKVLQTVRSRGIKTYIQNGESYGSYTPMKDVYVSLDEDTLEEHIDTIQNEQRKVEGDTILYRILSHNFQVENKNYLLEVGISLHSVNETSRPLQSIAFMILVAMVVLTVLADQIYSTYVLRPLGQIIKTKLIGQKFPNFASYKKIETSTSDFEYLDISIHRMIKTIEDTFQKEREFISNASHELMTPISILQSKIENMFEREDISDEVKTRLLEMQRILNRLKSITKTLLLISQIENEQFLKEDEVPLHELLAEIYDEISIRLQDRNISYAADVPQDLALVNINKFLMFNLFFNLINNAAKYNHPNGSITIAAAIENGAWVVKVADTGIGISRENMPLIFNRFKKLRASMKQESFGLGLPIVQSIAAFHGIKIDVQSEEGRGSVFKLILPDFLIKIW